LQPSDAASGDLEVSYVLPCLNEAESIAACIAKAQRTIDDHNLRAEIIIADNGSTDGSQAIATSLGARVVAVPRRGYGAALQGGIVAARGRFIVMADADDSYDLSDTFRFIEKLRDGFDLVIGNRFRGGIASGAMPPLHRYLGNPVLSGIGRLFFRSDIGDFHCGLRAFTKSAFDRMQLRTTGMEFASEMIVKATLLGMRIGEVPATLSVAGRTRPPHLRSWRDGWRHLRFLLLYSPRWLFLYPGIAMMVAGFVTGAAIVQGATIIRGLGLDVDTLLYAAAAMMVGYQAILFAFFTKIFAVGAGLLPHDERFTRYGRFLSLETGLAAGFALALAGLGGSIYAVDIWRRAAFGPLSPYEMMRLVIPSVTAMTIGVETILASFFLSVLALARR
jgi:glycosyltransferase involved in cell wall biosynthesis